MPPSPPNSTGSGRADSERRPDLARRRGEELMIGRLIGHGRANYQFRLEEDQS